MSEIPKLDPRIANNVTFHRLPNFSVAVKMKKSEIVLMMPYVYAKFETVVCIGKLSSFIFKLTIQFKTRAN